MSSENDIHELRFCFSYQRLYEECMRSLRPYIERFVREIFGFEERKNDDEKED